MEENRVPYEHARSLVKSGDIIFIRNKGFFHHKLITWFTRSDHIHVGIAFWTNIEGKDHLMISEANGGAQRRIVNLSHYKDLSMDIIVAPREWDLIKEKALERLGEVQYNWIQAGYVGVSELIQNTFGYTIPDIDMPGEICSEFVANVLELSFNHMSPAALYRYLHVEQGHPIRILTI